MRAYSVLFFSKKQLVTVKILLEAISNHFRIFSRWVLLSLFQIKTICFPSTYSGYHSHAPLNDFFFHFSKLNLGGRQSINLVFEK